MNHIAQLLGVVPSTVTARVLAFRWSLDVDKSASIEKRMLQSIDDRCADEGYEYYLPLHEDWLCVVRWDKERKRWRVRYGLAYDSRALNKTLFSSWSVQSLPVPLDLDLDPIQP